MSSIQGNWSDAELYRINHIAASRKFDSYGEAQLEAFIDCSRHFLTGTMGDAQVAKENIRELQGELERRAQAETEKGKLQKMGEITGHVANLNERVERNEHVVRDIRKEARLIGLGAILVAILIPVSEHYSRHEQAPAVTQHPEITNSSAVSVPAFTNTVPHLSAVSTTQTDLIATDMATTAPATTDSPPSRAVMPMRQNSLPALPAKITNAPAGTNKP